MDKVESLPEVSPPSSPAKSGIDPDQALALLREQERILQDQKGEIEQRIRQLETGRRAVPTVVAEKCVGCGICVDVCPEDAIEIDKRAVINTPVCTGCAACTYECPNEAIILRQQEFGA